MGRKNSKKNKRNGVILAENTPVGSYYNITESVKNIKLLYEMSQSVDKDLIDILLYFGEKGLGVDDIAILANMPKQTLRDIFKQGEQDFELGVKSVQSGYYRAWLMGRKMFEAQTTQNASKKDPMKLLAILNPVEYSDKVTDKYELPAININFGGLGVSVDTEEKEREEDEVNE